MQPCTCIRIQINRMQYHATLLNAPLLYGVELGAPKNGTLFTIVEEVVEIYLFKHKHMSILKQYVYK